MNWHDIINAAIFFVVLMLVWFLLPFINKLDDREPFKGHKVLSVNGETALVLVGDYSIVAQNPFPELKAGDCVHIREQGSGFAPYTVITHIY